MSTIKSSAENLTLNADGANNDIIFQSNGSTKVTLDGQNSRVGIGTTSPDSVVEIEGASPILTITDTDASGANFGLWIRELGSHGMPSDGTAYGAFLSYDMADNEFQLQMRNGSDTHEALTVARAGGDVTVGTGDLIFGTAGKGICLGVTSNTDANTLDDYEEGTFTPTIAFAGGSTSITYSTNTGSYTKVGNLVTWYAHLTLSSKGSSTGYAQVRSLPFTCNGTHYGFGVIAYSSNWNTAIENDENWQHVQDINSTNLSLRTLDTSGIGANILDSDFNNNTQILVGGSFQV